MTLPPNINLKNLKQKHNTKKTNKILLIKNACKKIKKIQEISEKDLKFCI